MIDGHGDDIYSYEGIRVNFSSNIYAHADLSKLEAHLCRHIDAIRSYPEPSARSLEKAIAHECGIDADEVLVVSGATDAIYLIAQAFRDRKTYCVYHPTFSEYDDACRLFGYEERPDGALCWLCNPNNPTGRVVSKDFIKEASSAHEILVVDQSYEDYTDCPIPQPADMLCCDNIIQIHSMTKRYCVPGLRLGYLTAPAGIIRSLRQQYRPWAVNAIAMEAGKWLLANKVRLIPDLKAYLQEAQRLQQNLSRLAGVECFDTQTNFFLCTIQPRTATELKEYLAREHGILIRDASNFRGLTPHHFRVAAQTPEENDALVAAIAQFIQQR